MKELSGTQRFYNHKKFGNQDIHREKHGYPDYYTKLKNVLMETTGGITRSEIMKICNRSMDIESLLNAVQPGIMVWCDEKYPVPRYYMCDWVKDD